MTENREKMFDMNCKSRNIQLRPSAGNGVWLSALLFIAYLQTILRDPEAVQFNYELTTVLLFGMFLQTIECYIYLLSGKDNFLAPIVKFIPSLITSSLLCTILNQEVPFSIITSVVVLLTYNICFMWILKSLPFSFTFGEASIVSQGLITFFYNCFLKLPFIEQSKTVMEDLNIILQLGLMGVFIIILIVTFIPIFRKWLLFFPLLLAIIVGLCMFPIVNRPAAVILWNFVFSDIERIIIVVAYLALLGVTGFVVTWRVQKNQASSTSIRKVFHILVVLVYLPGLIFQCHFLYVASVVILAILIVLEVARVIKLYPVAEALELGVSAFIDEKDAGIVALTPLYLLAGCSLPLWIHNSPCDLTGSSAFELLPLLAGILSIGIGDTFASIIGSKLGRHKWPNSNKSIEGTLASITSQGAFIYFLSISGFLPLNFEMAAVCGVAVIINALIEALTDQVDNLVLPLVAYIVLAFK